jgi:EAL domain-containing protein (putative c-di-GMP-specific phosphodiesterase class I)
VAWLKAGIQPARMSVNVSPAQLMRSDFAQTVATVLAETSLVPDLLELEVTEGAMIESMAEAIREMEKVRRLGVRISIDDFGTGYSSLSYVHNLPVDAIKIDRSFVQELDGASRSAESVVRAIITLAHNLELAVVAEGVETEAQLEALFNMNCDLAQGYLLYRPMPAQAVERLLRESSVHRLCCTAGQLPYQRVS